MIWPLLEAHLAKFVVIQTHLSSPAFSTLPSISSAYAGTGLGRRSSIKAKIFWNKLRGTATSANWNVTYRPADACCYVEVRQHDGCQAQGKGGGDGTGFAGRHVRHTAPFALLAGMVPDIVKRALVTKGFSGKYRSRSNWIRSLT